MLRFCIQVLSVDALAIFTIQPNFTFKNRNVMSNPISLPPTQQDMDIMQQIISRHYISNNIFNGLVFAFFNELPMNLVPSVKTSQAMLDTLKDHVIEDKVLMTVTGQPINEDLEFAPDIKEANGDEGDGDDRATELSSYSVGLLLGLAVIFPESNFNFYKALKYIEGRMKSTVVFSVTQGHYPVYFGDLSEAHP